MCIHDVNLLSGGQENVLDGCICVIEQRVAEAASCKVYNLFACMHGHYLSKDKEWQILEVRLNMRGDSCEYRQVILASLVWDMAFT